MQRLHRANSIKFKVRFLPSKKIVFIFFNKSPLKMMNNTFYFILKAPFVLKIFKFLSILFWLCKKMA